MGMEIPEDDDRYRITAKDAEVIRAYQVMKAFGCLDMNVYRNNPTWWNRACYALLITENKAQADAIEAQNNG